MGPSQELVDDLYREKVERARRMSIEQRVLGGAELFDLSLALMAAGVRMQFPGLSEEGVTEKLRERLAIGRRLENRG